MVLARLPTPAEFGLLAKVLTVMGFLRKSREGGLSTATVQRDEMTHAQVSNLFWINVALSGLMTLVIARFASRQVRKRSPSGHDAFFPFSCVLCYLWSITRPRMDMDSFFAFSR
jgi:hypothetical protein